MKIEYLECFLALEKHLNFSEAANSLFISQSSLSKQIKALEKELNIQLFDRKAHIVRTLPAGKVFLPYAQKMVIEYRTSLCELSSYMEKINKKICIATIWDMSQYNITDMIIDFEKNHPNFHVESLEKNHTALINSLDTHLADLAIGYKEFWPTNHGYSIYPLLNDPLVLVMKQNHPNFCNHSPSLYEFRNEIFCLPIEDSCFFQLFIDLCQKAGFYPKHTLSDVRLSTIKKYILNGLRLTITTRLRSLNAFNEPEFLVIPLKDVKPLTLSILARTNPKTICQQFIDHAKEYYKQINP